ncbi:hypothetical protein VOLCADRAFT_89416 [Volvox carteri f. nagariensis]|uniref:Fe2OG dioxygenase domain-containing protein n=1 Tax=Volvox carteri f. nagariensis TaxID=3068 RepID=D8TRM7_VOLCA|nr:uncharacterized protein VOLCADRAFT_89416 [Volvox carteri f. nagariensis]EFJ50018.1 hypothetical protein VOLCADRAFT_89416 [Volvox carteri f. nagariensis]|eukprot:XP_002949083.1 hypothetical protein VOLCADRAFT_89416 [Volvox carteri f. nagariensis]
MRTATNLLIFCALLWPLPGNRQVTALEDVIEEQLIGWKGETYNVQKSATSPGPGSGPWVETVSWMPRAFVYHQFLTPAECDHLIELATPKLERSMVVGTDSDLIDDIRTSFSASIMYGETSIVSSIEERIARWTVLRYVNGQKYDAHWDWFDDNEVAKAGGSNRMATVLMYLSDVDPAAGGETALPLAEPLDPHKQSVDGQGYSQCAARMGISIRPRKGDVLLFWDMDPAGLIPDRHALHASCPTFSGTKWTATKWIHNKPYR